MRCHDNHYSYSFWYLSLEVFGVHFHIFLDVDCFLLKRRFFAFVICAQNISLAYSPILLLRTHNLAKTISYMGTISAPTPTKEKKSFSLLIVCKEFYEFLCKKLRPCSRQQTIKWHDTALVSNIETEQARLRRILCYVGCLIC